MNRLFSAATEKNEVSIVIEVRFDENEKKSVSRMGGVANDGFVEDKANIEKSTQFVTLGT